MKQNYEDMTDEEIIRIIRKEESPALDFLMEKYKHLVRQKVRKLYLAGGDQEDLIQEGMIGLYKAIRDFKDDKACSFATFAGQCISCQIYDAIKASNRKKNIPLNTYISFYTPVSDEIDNSNSLLDFFSDKNANPEQLVIDKERVNVLEYELGERLSSFEKQIFDLYSTGISYTSIAEMLHTNPKSVDNGLQRIKAKLSRLLKELN